MTAPIRILIVDDDVPTRIGLRAIFNAETDITVVGESAEADDAYAKVISTDPDIVLMDVQLRGSDGISATERILQRPEATSRPRIIVLTTYDLDEYAYRSLRAGASGFLLKRTRAEDIVNAVRTVAAGTALPMPELAVRLIDSFVNATEIAPPTGDLRSLTDREWEVLALIARGLSNQEIAERLAIRPDTVKSHIKHVFSKLGVRDRAQAVIVAYEGGLVMPGTALPAG